MMRPLLRSCFGLALVLSLPACGVDPLPIYGGLDGGDAGGGTSGDTGGNGGIPGRAGSGGGDNGGSGGDSGGTGGGSGTGGASGGTGGGSGTGGASGGTGGGSGTGGASGGTGGASGGTGGASGGTGGAMGGTGGTVEVGEGASCGGFRAPPIPVCGPNLFCELPAGSCHIADIPGTCAVVTGICPAIYAPVCGCDGKTYPSDCDRRAARAQLDHTGECGGHTVGAGQMCGGIAGIQCNPGLFCDPTPGSCKTADAGGICTITTALCSKNYAPVCGCDGKTYGNDCLRVSARVGKQSDGACKSMATRLGAGVWGGPGAVLTVNDPAADASIEFSCAHGTITGPLDLGPDGSFKWPGTWTAEGGVVRDPPNPPLSAVYFGSVVGDTLNLQVIVNGSQMPQTFTLTLNAKPRLLKCL